MAAYKPISHIWADYRLDADNHRRAHQIWLDSDPELHELDALIQDLGMQLLQESHAGRETGALAQKLNWLDTKKASRAKALGGSKYRCDMCHDTGVAGGRYCTCIRNRIYREHYHAYDPLKNPISLDTYSLDCFSEQGDPEQDNFSPREAAGLALQVARDLVNTLPDADAGLFIHGQPGLGKTWLAGALARSAAEKGVDIAYIHAVPLFSMYHMERLGRNVDMSYIESAQLLIVDDLGAEPMTANVTIESLLHLLTIRSEEHLPSVFVTNQENIQALYGERISSRMRGSDYHEVRMIGDDLRDKYKHHA